MSTGSIVRLHPPCSVGRATERTVVTPGPYLCAQTAIVGAARRSGWRTAPGASFFGPGGIPRGIFGPGNVDFAHGDDEYVEIDEVAVAAEIITAAIVELG